MTDAGRRAAGAALLILALVNLLNYYERMPIVVVSPPLRLEFGLCPDFAQKV